MCLKKEPHIQRQNCQEAVALIFTNLIKQEKHKIWNTERCLCIVQN